MDRISTTFSISLPPEMADALERVRRKEHRTRSELVREALRRYMRAAEIQAMQEKIAKLPEEDATAEEIAAIKKGRAEFRQGKFVTLDKLRHELDRRGRQRRAKKSPARSRR
jgi:predicted transcriptional regulator